MIQDWSCPKIYKWPYEDEARNDDRGYTMKIDDKSSSFICTPYTVNHDYSMNRLCCQLSIKYITLTLTSLTHIIMKIIIRVMIMIIMKLQWYLLWSLPTLSIIGMIIHV